MGYFDEEHLVAPKITAGPSVGFFDNVSQGFEQQYRVDSPLALRNELDNRWKESLLALEAATGEKQTAPWGDAITNYAREVAGEQVGDPVGLPPQALEVYRKQIQSLRDTDERIRGLGDPDIHDFASIVQETIKMQQGVEAQTAEYSERSGVMGDIGQFIGTIGGSFTTRDPVSLFTLPLGGEGRTIATRIGSEMLVGGAGAAASSIGVNDNRQFAGLEARNPLYEIVAGAVGAGLLRGGMEGLGHALDKLRAGEKIDLTIEDEQLASMFRAAPESPRARAGLALLDEHDALRAASPYGDSDAGLRRFTGELTDVARVFGGQADTAVARFLPPLPFEYIERNLDFELVKAERPEVYAQLEVAKARLDEVDARITGLETQADHVPFLEALDQIDEATGGLVRSFAEDLQNPQLDARARANIERQINTIVESIGPEVIDRAARDLQIQPRQDLKRARQERKAANRRYKDAYDAMEVEVARIKTGQQILKGAKPQAGSILDASPVLGDSMRHEVVAARAEATAKAADLTDERAKQIVEASRPVETEATPPAAIGTAAPVVDVNSAKQYPFETGEPVTVHGLHGTAENFDEFDPSKMGSMTGAEGAKVATWFATKKTTAKYYGKTAASEANRWRMKGDKLDPQGTIIERHITMNNPLVVDLKNNVFHGSSMDDIVVQAKADGYDGIIVKRAFDAGEYSRLDALMKGRLQGETLYAVFDHTQIGAKITDEVGAKAASVEGLIDIGLDEPVPDFEFPTEDGPVTLKQAMADLREDEALEEAMRICSL